MYSLTRVFCHSFLDNQILLYESDNFDPFFSFFFFYRTIYFVRTFFCCVWRFRFDIFNLSFWWVAVSLFAKTISSSLSFVRSLSLFCVSVCLSLWCLFTCVRSLSVWCSVCECVPLSLCVCGVCLYIYHTPHSERERERERVSTLAFSSLTSNFF